MSDEMQHSKQLKNIFSNFMVEGLNLDLNAANRLYSEIAGNNELLNLTIDYIRALIEYSAGISRIQTKTSNIAQTLNMSNLDGNEFDSKKLWDVSDLIEFSKIRDKLSITREAMAKIESESFDNLSKQLSSYTKDIDELDIPEGVTLDDIIITENGVRFKKK